MDHVKLGPRLGQDVMLPSPGGKKKHDVDFVVGQEKTVWPSIILLYLSVNLSQGKDTIHFADLPATLATWGVDTGYPDTGYPPLATHKADTGYPDTGYPTLATQRWRHWLPSICNL